ncbi:MAG: carboxylating nicotinate-nucleotide diphosphorylase [Sandaracinaceae bacterium]|nr:carboxylating nicotinate-nucleotide diphosphorylase [Sandaracinaceae bacterium]MDW8247061.1 carboxylating nicotinate-nucleotide diphosphorylase [Sandaracinaceae bacterium]
MNLPSLFPPVVDEIIRRALAEDIASGDVTTEAIIPIGKKGEALLVARENLVVAGLPVFAAVFSTIDPGVKVEQLVKDGEWVVAGGVLARIRGEARVILSGERVALNFIQRMSGIATRTRAFVEAVPPGCTTKICDTRKTTPGLRVLERYAVRCGGGWNHRDHLGAGVLIKDNHIACVGSVREAIRRARAWAPHVMRIQCEVDSISQLVEAIEAGADGVLLDNFSDEDIQKAMEVAKGRVFVEVSGGITIERIPRIATMGVDVISIGSLTHSARAVDMGIDWLEGTKDA